MATWSRSTATMAMTSPLGTDILIPISLTAHEALSQPFNFEVVAVCQNGVIDPNSLLNNPACVILQDETGSPVRYFHGIVRSVTDEGTVRSDTAVANYELYRLILVPRLWFLSQTTDCRVYEMKSAGDILNSMFTDASLTDLSGPPSSVTRQYTIQYNETDLHFATRLMEEEGWFYFFQHTASAHTLVIANQNSAFTAIANATLYIIGGADGTFHMLDFDQTSVTVRGQMTLAGLRAGQPRRVAAKRAADRVEDRRRIDARRFPLAGGGELYQRKRHRSVCQRQRQHHPGRQRRRQPREMGDGGVGGGRNAVRRVMPVRRPGAGRDLHHHQPAGQRVRQHLCGAQRHAQCHRRHLAEPERHRVLFQPVHRVPVRDHVARADHHAASEHERHLHRAGDGAAELRAIHHRRPERRGNLYRRHGAGEGAVLLGLARRTPPAATRSGRASSSPGPARAGARSSCHASAPKSRSPSSMATRTGRSSSAACTTARRRRSICPPTRPSRGIRTRSSLSGSTSQFNELTFDDNASNELIFMHAEKDMFTEIENDQTLTVDNCRIVTVKQNERSRSRTTRRSRSPATSPSRSATATAPSTSPPATTRSRSTRATRASRSARATAPSTSVPATTPLRSTRATRASRSARAAAPSRSTAITRKPSTRAIIRSRSARAR